MSIHGSENLTVANPALAGLQGRSVPGMMHWSGTGPADATCGECVFFRARKIKSGENKGKIGEGRCHKYVRFMRGLHGRAPVHKIPPATVSCRHFERKLAL